MSTHLDKAELWTVNDLAAAWKMSPHTIRRWHEDGRIPSMKIGGTLVRFDPDVMRAFAHASKPERL